MFINKGYIFSVNIFENYWTNLWSRLSLAMCSNLDCITGLLLRLLPYPLRCRLDESVHSLLSKLQQPGLNFINVLHTAFMLVGPKSIRIQSSSWYFFTLLGSMCAKAARRTLMKLTPGVNFINILQAAFMHAYPENTKKTDSWLYLLALLRSAGIKAAHKTLMKLTSDRKVRRI